MAAETLAPAGFRGGITWPGIDGGHEGRGVTGRQCPWRWHQPRSGAVLREETPEFQRFTLAASAAKPLMSALWTPSRCGIESSGPLHAASSGGG